MGGHKKVQGTTILKTNKIKSTPRKKDVTKTKTRKKEVIDYSVDDHIV